MSNVYTQFERIEERDDQEEIQSYIDLLGIVPDEIGVPEFMSWVPSDEHYD